jgi:predicted DNA-binding transcriptional regulator AlpA
LSVSSLTRFSEEKPLSCELRGIKKKNKSHISVGTNIMKRDRSKDEFVSTGDIHKAVGISRTTLWILLKQGEFKRGIHYYDLGPRTRRWNRALMLDWALNRSNPEAHQRRIEQFLQELELDAARAKKAKPPKTTAAA